MNYDVVIIGAGMSGLGAGVRLAHFDKRVCIIERHHACGGLNSYYTRDGRAFDVGLHAVTNYVPPGRRHAPLPKLLRQLRLTREDFDLCPQYGSEIRFPGRTLKFNNAPELLTSQVAEQFPDQIDRFRRLWALIVAFDDTRLEVKPESARRVLGEHLTDPLLLEMLLCPVMYYGCAAENDMDFARFATIFTGIFCEGLARPREGVRRIIRTLVNRYRAAGGSLRMGDGVRRINVQKNRVVSLTLESGEELTAEVVISSAGYGETMQLCSDAPAGPAVPAGRLSFVEAISILDTPPAALGLDATVIFFNDGDVFRYARPRGPVDVRSGVICCPNNFERHDDMTEGVVRTTALAGFDAWDRLGQDAYGKAKREWYERLAQGVETFAPGFRQHVVYWDFFTPRTIHKYTGHLGGAVYGAPSKVRDGRTRLENLFICGTDQGLVGIVGALMSGIWMASLHVLSPS